MAQVTVTISGYGSYQVDAEKVQQLLVWLSSNKAVNVTENTVVREVKNNAFTGRSLING